MSALCRCGVGAWVEFDLGNFVVAQRRLLLGRACNSVQGATATLAFTARLPVHGEWLNACISCNREHVNVCHRCVFGRGDGIEIGADTHGPGGHLQWGLDSVKEAF
jgi:hypothetical protein